VIIDPYPGAFTRYVDHSTGPQGKVAIADEPSLAIHFPARLARFQTEQGH
jgi:hypothetical protein